ncbi:acyl carrier protein [Kitasatospora sp. MAP12-15]|uniref:phosphopantetheine-binding protein n=1 Tax=unclassified Kitasatospora TaxID=2633591 RepID=UPI00247389F7|nr:phosphopantetheine-binding protein [Kitasatospora sp. MAP12-44]MDH6113894.1 acyl carrier protein [Kitasatospora sp. MAP12-44]
MTTHLATGDVRDCVKRLLGAQCAAALDPADIRDDEPLAGGLLALNSLALLQILVELEDELEVLLPDDIFVGRTFRTVQDLIAVVLGATEAAL